MQELSIVRAVLGVARLWSTGEGWRIEGEGGSKGILATLLASWQHWGGGDGGPRGPEAGSADFEGNKNEVERNGSRRGPRGGRGMLD